MPPINEKGPKCAWCACRPDDPMWVQPAGQTRGLGCLGCVADMRAMGAQVRVLHRAWFAETEEAK